MSLRRARLSLLAFASPIFAGHASAQTTSEGQYRRVSTPKSSNAAGVGTSPPASSPPAASVHSRVVFDNEQWRREHPLPAAKRPANLNVGEPRTVRLWNVASREEIVTLPGASSDVSSLSISTNGTTLAAGSWLDGTITLWDLSEEPRPLALEIISGDGQQGAPGTVLPQPLVVEVRDQYGDPLPDAHVTFTITTGEGQLSGQFNVEHTITDANGRATATLTLGPRLGPKTVVATVGNLKPVTFTATVIANADFNGDGTVGFGDFLQFAANFGLSNTDQGF